jgi:hypothetical protein
VSTAAVDWWQSGGISSANALAVFQPVGAASLAASYTNLANPGTNDAAPGTEPTFDPSYGWALAAASSQYLVVGSGALVTAVPLTFAVLFQSNDVTTSYVLAGIKRNTTTNDGWTINAAGAAPGDPIRANSVQNNTTVVASSTAGYTASAWYTAIAVFSTNSARAAFLDGANKGSEATANTPSTSVNATLIGANHTGAALGSFLDGKIAAIAFYNAALSDGQAEALHTAMMALVS